LDPTRSASHRTIFSLAWPVIVSLLSLTAMGLVDALFVGRLGTNELAAVGLAIPLVYLILAAPFGILLGAKVVVAQRFGAADALGVERAAWSSLGLGAVLGLLGLSAGLWVLPLARATGAPEAVAVLAERYVLIRAHGAVLVFVFQAMQGAFQGRGNTRTPMAAVLLSNVATIALEPFLIFGVGPFAGMGIEGAALANTAGQGIGALALVHPFVRAHPWDRAAWDGRIVRWILDLGLPLGVQRLVEVGSFVVFSALVARMGASALAAHVLVLRIIGLSFLPSQGFAQAAEVLAGQAVGAGNRAGARRVFTLAVQLAVAVAASWAVIFVAIPGILLAPFQLDPAVARTAVALLAISAAFQVFDAMAEVAEGTLAGIGATRWVLATSIVECWFVRLTLAFFLSSGLGLGVEGVWGGLAIGITLRGLVGAARVWWGGQPVAVPTRVVGAAR
jgi:multidrug resistance protein, MATE family